MAYTGTGAIIGKGTTFGSSATSGGTYTNFAEILKVGFPKPTTKDIEATNMDSLMEEFIQGLPSAGEVDVEQNYNKADLIALYAMVGVKKFFKITLPDAAVFTFGGFVKEPTGDSGFGDKLVTKFKVKITGAVTLV
jgi:hypothetical protein